MRLLKKSSSSAPLFSSCFPPPRTLGFNSSLNYKPTSKNRQINENEYEQAATTTTIGNDTVVFDQILLHNYCRGRFPVKQFYFPKKKKFSKWVIKSHEKFSK